MTKFREKNWRGVSRDSFFLFYPFSGKNPLSSILRVPYWPTGRSVYKLYFKCTIRPKVGWVCSVRQLGSGKYLQTWQSEPGFRLNIFNERTSSSWGISSLYSKTKDLCRLFLWRWLMFGCRRYAHISPCASYNTEFHANFPRTSNASGYNMLPYWFGVNWIYLANAFWGMSFEILIVLNILTLLHNSWISMMLRNDSTWMR